MLYLSTTKGIFRVNPETGVVARLGPLDTSTEALAVASPLGSPGAAAAGDILVAAITPDYGLPMRGPLAPASHQGTVRSADAGRTWSSIPALAGQQITALAAAPLTIGKGGRGDRAPTRPPSGVPASATGP